MTDDEIKNVTRVTMDLAIPLIRAQVLAEVRAEVTALRDEAMDHERATGDPTFATAIVAYQTVLGLLKGSSLFPPHQHVGDDYDPDHCVYTLANGERCMAPVDGGNDDT